MFFGDFVAWYAVVAWGFVAWCVVDWFNVVTRCTVVAWACDFDLVDLDLPSRSGFLLKLFLVLVIFVGGSVSFFLARVLVTASITRGTAVSIIGMIIECWLFVYKSFDLIEFYEKCLLTVNGWMELVVLPSLSSVFWFYSVFCCPLCYYDNCIILIVV